MNSATRWNMTFFVSVARSRTPPTKKLFASGEKDESGVFDFFDKLSFAIREFHSKQKNDSSEPNLYGMDCICCGGFVLGLYLF